MDTLVSYLLKMIITSAILVIYYWIALRNKRFHQYNRWYLLSAIAISLVAPLLHFRIYLPDQPAFTAFNDLLSPWSVTSAGSTAATMERAAHFAGGGPGWSSLLFAASALVSTILLLALVSKIAGLQRIKSRHPVTHMNGFCLIETELEQAPFSFFNNLYWRKNISMEDETGRTIFLHELTHIREGHSYDKLLSQLAACIFWMNPFFWLIQKELSLVHEFAADERSVKEEDCASFARMLLHAYSGGRYLDPSHAFFYSPIKRRLVMITTPKKTPFS
ncbi:MAG TPA: M56 family metallopeptidase [Puia sp.]|nr:M56 family metallopeptidase [Puia sp.]